MLVISRIRSIFIIPLVLMALPIIATADIYEWEYVDPGQPSLGKKESDLLTPDGAGIMPAADVDLSSLDLTMAYLIGSDLTRANFYQAQLSAADLSGATLYDANLHDVSASQANFINSDLREAYLGAGDFAGADFSHADLRNSFLVSADLSGTNFTRATIEGANLSHATFHGLTSTQFYSTASYQNRQLDYIDFGDSDLSGWDFSGQSMMHVVFSSGNQTQADFSSAKVVNANFVSPKLDDAVFVNSDLTGTFLQHGTLLRANFTGAKLVGVNASGDLTDANFTSADLTDAVLDTATLTNAVFDGAIVTGARFRGGLWNSSQLYSTASYQNRQLQRLYLHGDLTGWNFADQDLTEATFRNSTLAGATFTSATLVRVELYNTELNNADFTDALLMDANFDSATLSDTNLTRADLTAASFDGVDLSTAEFTDARVEYANLDRIPRQSLYATASYKQGQLPGVRIEYFGSEPLDLSSQNLLGATLQGYLGEIDLAGSDVRGAEFEDSSQPGDPLAFSPEQIYSTASYQAQDLEGVTFRIRILPTINFQGQNLALSTFTATEFGGSDFSGADLRGAEFSTDRSGPVLPEENILNTIFPDGSIYGLHLTGNQNLVVRDHDGGIVAGVGRMGPHEVPPTAIVIHDEFVMDESGTLTLRFDDDEWNSSISFDAGIPVQLGGTLELTFAGDVNVLDQVGRTFDVFDWTGVAPSGQFAIASEYVWDLSDLYTSGQITLLALPEPPAIGLAIFWVLGLTMRFCGR